MLERSHLRCYLFFLILLISCRRPAAHDLAYNNGYATVSFADGAIDSSLLKGYDDTIAKVSVLRNDIVAFAKTLIGTPYKFGCTAPETGFDCSGFITYVFNHFGITVPRSSVEFTNVGESITRSAAHPGDLILFTGTDARKRTVGHIGIIIDNDDGNLTFIHSSSGKEFSVTITPLNDYYMGRFVKVIRIIP